MRSNKNRDLQRSASGGEKRLDVAWLLQATQNGLEDAEFLLHRAQRSGIEPASGLGRAWNEACFSVEQLDELHASGGLRTRQAERFLQLSQRMARLLPLPRKHNLPAPRIAWEE